MTKEYRRGEIPSYRDVATGEGTSNNKLEEEIKTLGPVLEARWQAGSKGKCLLCAAEKSRFVIPMNKLERYRSYMKDHALICNFINVWLLEKDLTRWMKQKWQPRGHIELKLGARGFFMVIFSNLQDKERVFENGPYFHNNVALFMRYWEECYNPDKEKFLAALVWVRVFGLPTDFWDPEILEGIGNAIGRGKIYLLCKNMCLYEHSKPYSKGSGGRIP